MILKSTQRIGIGQFQVLGDAMDACFEIVQKIFVTKDEDRRIEQLGMPRPEIHGLCITTGQAFDGRAQHLIRGRSEALHVVADQHIAGMPQCKDYPGVGEYAVDDR